MNKTFLSLLFAAVAGTAAVALLADEREHESDEHESYEDRDHDEDHGRGGGTDRSGSAYLSDPVYVLYKTECGDCHMAYPPTTLPPASWQGMMGSLDDHFGDNAELDAATAERITAFLARHAAAKGRGEYAERAWMATRGRTPPMRITQTDYFLGKHHEVPAKMVQENQAIGSFSRCDACHSGAERGDFAEHGVRIPGYGRWDD